MSRDQKAALHCAIYTRKSSEEGLEQSFNSLDAQREACAAFIASQRHWFNKTPDFSELFVPTRRSLPPSETRESKSPDKSCEFPDIHF